MKKNEISIGQTYVSKVSGKLTTVRVDDIREELARYSRINGRNCPTSSTHYHVTNLRTGRQTVFRSAAKFRSVAQ